MSCGKKWRPESWSAQARELADKIISQVVLQQREVKEAREFFSKSYRHKRIRYRAAKRFGRWERRTNEAYTRKITERVVKEQEEYARIILSKYSNLTS